MTLLTGQTNPRPQSRTTTGATVNHREDLRNTQDFFVYCRYLHKWFPEKHRMTPARAIAELISAVETATKRSKSKTARRWLNLSLQELFLARTNLESCQMSEVERHLASAESF